MESWVIGIIGAVIGLIAALLAMKTFGAKGNSEAAEYQSEQLRASQAELAGRLAQLSEDSRKSQAELAKALSDRLDTMSHRMGDNLKNSAESAAKSFGEIKTRLKVIDEAQDNIKKLGGDIVGLQDILSNKQERGYFGETQMEDLVRNTLPPNAYEFQATLSNGKRPDCLIKLPDPHKDIVLDCKFPLEGYKAFISVEDSERAAYRKAFAVDVLKHVQAISEKYMIPGETSDQAMMFLPSEAVYAELHANFPDIIEKSHKARVWIVSPTTLMATLHTARAVLKDAAMQEQAGLIQAEVGKMLEDVLRLDERVGKLANHFDQAERDIKLIQTSTSKVTKRATAITEVEMDSSPTAIEGPEVGD